MDEALVPASVLEPHFDAVRDAFARFSPSKDHGCSCPGKKHGGHGLCRLLRTKLLVSPAARSSARHFAMTDDTGARVVVAPALAELDVEEVTAILLHELGHAADFAYPGAWTWPKSAPRSGEGPRSEWIGEDQAARARAWRWRFGKASAVSRRSDDDLLPASNWMGAWARRSADEVEWAADGIAEAVTGVRPRYCGDLLVQCLDVRRGIERPAGLR